MSATASCYHLMSLSTLKRKKGKGKIKPSGKEPGIIEWRASYVTQKLEPKINFLNYFHAGTPTPQRVAGVTTQLLTTTEWGELDYLVVDFPPGTGDIQLTLCQSVAFSAAVVVTTPQKLAFIDVAKGIRMFARLAVPLLHTVKQA